MIQLREATNLSVNDNYAHELLTDVRDQYCAL